MTQTENAYHFPLADDTAIEKVVTDSPGHKGPYEGAIDFAVEVGTSVLAPLEGKVMTVVDDHSEYGPTIEFADKANYIQIKHTNGETSDFIHLAKGSVLVKVGDKVETGQEIGKTGLSGWMTAPHLHWFVFRCTDSKVGFEGLKIKLHGTKQENKGVK